VVYILGNNGPIHSPGTVCDVKECSQIPLRAGSSSQLQGDMLSVIHQIHSLSREQEVLNDPRNRGSTSSRSGDVRGGSRSRSGSGGDPSLLDGVDLNAYYSVLVNLYSVLMPLLGERFAHNLPTTLVCILSGTPECGLEAQLVRTVTVELAKPLLAVLSFMRSETCTAPPDGGAGGALRSYLRMDEAGAAELTSFQEMLISVLSQVPLSGNLMSPMSGVLDMFVSYFSTVVATLIQVPLDYVNIGLQFGIKVPSLNESEQCQQGKECS